MNLRNMHPCPSFGSRQVMEFLAFALDPLGTDGIHRSRMKDLHISRHISAPPGTKAHCPGAQSNAEQWLGGTAPTADGHMWATPNAQVILGA